MLQVPTLHVLHGFLGSGKTTFAKELAEEVKAVRFTHDEWMSALYGTNPPLASFADNYERVDKLIWMMAERVLKSGADVIFDYGFWKKDYRDKVRGFAKDLGVEFKLYRLECPKEVARERIKNRTEQLPEGELYIDDNAFDVLWTRFEPLDEATEPFISVNRSH